MAFRWMDGFDCYATAGFDEAGYSGFGGGSVVDTAVFRIGTASLKSLDVSNFIDVILDAQSTWIVGFGFRFSALTGGIVPVTLIDNTTGQVDLRINSTGHLIVTRAGTQLGSQGATVLSINQWYHIQFKATIHNSTGTVDVLLNGVSEISLTGQDTQNTGNATADKISFSRGTVGGASSWHDDLYICDGTGGGTYADFLGDLRIETIMPNGNGNTSNLTGSDGNSTDNYLLVDETTPNDDTDYVESSTVNDKDTYAYGNLTSTSGTVMGVMPMPYARKTDAGARSIASIVRTSGTEEDSSNKTLNTTYNYYRDIRTTKPGGGAFSISDVNASEIGVKVTA